MNLDPVRAALADALRAHGAGKVELEYRLGRMVGDAFVPGVAREAFATIQRLLDSNPAAIAKTTCDTHEMLNGTDARFVRTGEHAAGAWVYKKKIASVTEGISMHDFVQRASVALEITDHPPPPADAPPFKYHRTKKRTSYAWRGWRYDLTRVTSNLPHLADLDEEILEVEIELADTAMVYVYTLEHLVEWGRGLAEQLQHAIMT
jgi:hypothetical protein